MPSKPKPQPERGPLLAYVIGLALGDGNLSNPNGRATRLRITCDAKYPNLASRMKRALEELLPQNRVSIVSRSPRWFDLSCYSNHWETLLGWEVGKGSKYAQRVRVPEWIKPSREYSTHCLRGLLETDGSVYSDRGYLMVMFVAAIPTLAQDVFDMVSNLGFTPHFYTFSTAGPRRSTYHVRLSKHVEEFLRVVPVDKR